MYVCSMDINFASFYDFWIGIWNDICFGLFFFVVVLYVFFLAYSFFLFSNNIFVYIYYLCQLGITTAVQTEKQKNVLNLEPLNVVL
jgi:hypothetical protein